MEKLPLLELLYAALHSPLGVVVETSDAEFLRQKLYPMRKASLAEFEHLAFVISPLNGADLWILNRSPPDAQDG